MYPMTLKSDSDGVCEVSLWLNKASAEESMDPLLMIKLLMKTLKASVNYTHCTAGPEGKTSACVRFTLLTRYDT